MAKKIGVIVLVLVFVLAAALAWMWHRITALPDWYGSADMIAEDGRPRVDEDWVQIPAAERPADAPPNARVYQLRNPHLRASSKAAPVKQAIRRSRATYSGGNLEAGAVINLSKIDLDSLSAKERARYEDTIEAFPALTGRDVYVGIEGGVASSEGKLALGPNSKLRVGDTRYSIGTVAKRLGVSQAELRKTIQDELGRMNVDLPTNESL
jgi:Flp pilus assembly protein CpaB